MGEGQEKRAGTTASPKRRPKKQKQGSLSTPPLKRRDTNSSKVFLSRKSRVRRRRNSSRRALFLDKRIRETKPRKKESRNRQSARKLEGNGRSRKRGDLDSP